MPYVDIDELMGKQEKRGFTVKGKDYAIPELSYTTLTAVMEKQQELHGHLLSGEPKMAKEALRLTLEIICLVVPDMTEDIIKNDLSQRETKEVNRIVNNFLNDVDEVEEVNEELEYYRKKYEDEYRKNENAAEESEEKKNEK